MTVDVKGTIHSFILHNYVLTDDESALRNDDSFIAQNIMDSSGVLEIIFFIEQTFDIKVSHEEIIPENFDSVDNLSAFVKRKQKIAT